MSIASLIRRMADAGASPEAIAIAVEAIEATQNADAERRAKAAEKKARQRATWRDKEGTVPGQPGDTIGTNLSPKERSPIPPKEITPIPVSEASASSTEVRAFDRFWAIFPNKVGKRDAESAFARALHRADLETILAGARRYATKTDDRPWCNPATFLNQDRWSDAPAPVAQRAPSQPPKPKTVGEMFRDDARRMGIIPNDQSTSTPDRRLVEGNGPGQGGSTGITRRFAIPADVLGRIGSG